MQSPPTSSTNDVSTRACQNCSRAKAKCAPQSENNQCARCFRLKRECIIPPKSTRKRRSPNTAKNTAQLEQKIESLVTLLSATQGNVLTSLSPEKQTSIEPAQETQQDDIRRQDHRPAFSWHVDPDRNIQPTHSSWDQELPVSRQSSAILASSTIPPLIAQERTSAPCVDFQVDDPDHLLKVYRKHYETEFPFVVLPPNITTAELKARNPWLSITISMVASHENRTQQLVLAKQIIMEVSAALFLRCEKSLDLLEALIVYNVWQYYYAPLNPQFLSPGVMQLALAVLFDLGLNKPLRENEGPDIVADTFKLAADNTKELRRSSEERRAFLSCFLMSSTLGCCIGRIDGLEPTPYLDYTCQSLVESAEFESDLVLGFATRAQSLVSSTSSNILRGGSDDIKAPPSMQAKLAKAELQSLYMSLPPTLQGHTLVRRSYHSAEIFFYESSLHRSLFPMNLNSQRLDMLYACLISAKSFLDIMSALPLSSFYGLSIVSLSQLSHGLSTVFKLSFLDVPGWDLVHVRETVNLLPYFEHFISQLGQIGAQIDNLQRPPAKRSFFTGCSLAMVRVKGWYEARLAAETEKKQQEEQPGLTGMEDILSGEKFDFMDDNLYAYFMGDWQDAMGEFMQQ